MKSYNSIFGHFACCAAYTIFGLNIVLCKDLTSSQAISPIALFSLRSIGAGMIFWIISLFTPKEKIDRQDFPKIFIASFLGFFLTQIFFLVAIKSITPMDCSIVSSMSPIYTMFIAAIALKEPLSTQKIGGVILSFCGIIYLIVNSVTSSAADIQTTPIGIILMIGNALCFSLYLGIFRPTITKYSIVTFMKWIFLFASLLSLPFSAKEIATIQWSTLPTIFLWELAFLIICATFITYFLIPIGQKLLRPTLVSLYSYMQPIVAIVISIYLGMDSLNWQKIVAALTVFTGVILVNFSRAKR